MKTLKKIFRRYSSINLIYRIVACLIIGVLLGLFIPQATPIAILGKLFVGALKAIAPVLVFALVLSSLAKKNSRLDRRFGLVILLYLVTTMLAAVTAVGASFVFPQNISLENITPDTSDSAPTGILQVLTNLLTQMFSNPVDAISQGNFIGVLFWAVVIGIAMKIVAKETTVHVLEDVAKAISMCVKWIINLAPIGILGLVFDTVAENGIKVFVRYGGLMLLLAGCMVFVALVVNPLVVFVVLRKNPYPLVFRCLKNSGITAFFTRSSAANIPVNMETCEGLGLDEDMYSVAIPLGATINMNGAAITITVMTLATAYTNGVDVSIGTAIVLSFIAAIGACGASGVAGGSLLLIPMACSLFGISNEIAMETVSVGFIIGVFMDSMETALNSSGDVLFAATAEYYECKKTGKELPYFLGGKRKVEL